MADTPAQPTATAAVADTPQPAPAVAAPETVAPADAGESNNEANGKSSATNNHVEHGDDGRGRSGRNHQHRGRGRGAYPKNGVKHRNDEFENLPESDDPVEIRAQVEFYFSSQNLATDEHLFLALEGPKNSPVPINHVCSFKRMRRFKPYSAVVNALRESKDLVVVGDTPGSEAIQRKDPLVVPTKEGDNDRPPTTQQLFYRLKNGSSNNMATSAYVKGFGQGEEVGQIALERFFRPYGSVMVRKRRDNDGTWKGSVFVEFDKEDAQQQFLALDPKPKFNDNELTIMGKKEYIEMKCKEKGIKPDWELTEEELKEKRAKWQSENGGHHRGSGRGGTRGRGDRGGRGVRGGRGGSRGGRGRDGNRNRSRSPRRRRDRSGSAGSVDSRDWNTRRDREQKAKKEAKEKPKDIERDGHGVPVVKDSRTEAEIAAASNKRKADSNEGESSPKKSKLEIKQDE